MKAFLKNHRQSPRKVRLVANLVKGKTADMALVQLQFTAKRSSDPIAKLLQSAIANAKANQNLKAENLIVKDIRVEKGITLKRSMPRARGSAFPIHKHSSHITVVLEEKKEVAPKAAVKAKK